MENFENLPSGLKCLKLKELLASTDYQAIKFAEGRMTAEEYAPIGEQRQAWRDEINRLEQEVADVNE